MNLRKQLLHALVAAVCLIATTSAVLALPDDPQNRLTKNRRKWESKWESKATKNYQYEFQRICFCLPASTRRVKITVREGVAENIQRADSGDAVDRAQYELYFTVDQLFDYIQAAIDKKAHLVKVTYDPELGYPTLVEIDQIKNAIDDEMRFKTGKLVVEKQ
ncbi:MAG TPA: DUF6174 domain-containing protein [Blastocatellia bacterium]|nr:DUF6174 domain-containing protein [Blastocatellia bacterium]